MESNCFFAYDGWQMEGLCQRGNLRDGFSLLGSQLGPWLSYHRFWGFLMKLFLGFASMINLLLCDKRQCNPVRG